MLRRLLMLMLLTVTGMLLFACRKTPAPGNAQMQLMVSGGKSNSVKVLDGDSTKVKKNSCQALCSKGSSGNKSIPTPEHSNTNPSVTTHHSTSSTSSSSDSASSIPSLPSMPSKPSLPSGL